ncbi:putative DNA binding domain-containing protein [candidate division KSB1 bacterium]|nr:putative DNA binding domain-containing protein [candidate division KSB1 bacterium]
MTLPININTLLQVRNVEWERLEFKAGWNPISVLHTVCAFANDFHNLGGGYIVLGVEEQHGRAVLPPVGLNPDELDSIQRAVVELGYRIMPYYHPVLVPYQISGKDILVLWCPGGQTRPYKAPVSLSKDNREYAYYIRRGSVTLRAQHWDEVELIELAATVPFDDRMNHRTSLLELDLGLMRTFLRQVGSDLYAESAKLDFLHLCRQMNIVDGPDEMAKPKNVGLMFFNEHPERFFPQTQIDVVQFPEGPGANRFVEKTFTGPLNRMLTDALSYIRTTLIEEQVVKHPDRPEAERCFNYPFAAIEEVVTNAIYHRSYEIREPVEVRILPDRVSVLSYPGPDRSIRDEDLKTFRFIARRYRNRRIGEFLKELDMTEGRGTGIPKILRVLQENGSSLPHFETDEERTFFIAEIFIHPAFIGEVRKAEQVTGEAGTKAALSRHQVEIIEKCFKDSTLQELMAVAGRSDRTKFRRHILNPLIVAKLIEMTIPDKPRSSKQKYRLTEKGRHYLSGVNTKIEE